MKEIEEIFIDQFTELIKMGIFENYNLFFIQLDDLYNEQQIQIRLNKEQVKKLLQKLQNFVKEEL